MTAKKNWTEEERLAAQRNYYAKNRDHKCKVKNAWAKANKDKTKNTMLKTKYGISLEQYEHLYAKNNGRCWICDEHYDTLFVDHCHVTNNIRGLLCTNCNFALGHFKDNTDNLKSAIKYLKAEPQIASQSEIKTLP